MVTTTKATDLKPRMWVSEDPTCNTAVVYSPNPVKVLMGTNIGFVPLGNTPTDPQEALTFALGIVEHYKLVEDPTFADYCEERGI